MQSKAPQNFSSTDNSLRAAEERFRRDLNSAYQRGQDM